MHIKFKKVTVVVKWILILFMLTSAVAYFSGFNFKSAPSVRVFKFMRAMKDSTYIPQWIAIFKIITAILLAIPQTTKLAILATLGYSINILLYCSFVANHYLGFAVIILITNLYLIYAYSDWFKPLFKLDETEKLINT